MTKNRPDSAAVFGAAIAALEKEAIDFEHRATATRALVRQLRDHASVTAAVPCQNQNQKMPGHARAAFRRPSAARSSSSSPSSSSSSSSEPEAVAELKRLVTEVSRLDGLIKVERNAAALKHHVAAALRAERRGGEIVIGLAGKVRLPVAKAQRQRWCRVAALTPKQFEAKIERTAQAAVAALGHKRPSITPAPKSAEPVSRSDVPYKASNGVSLAKTIL